MINLIIILLYTNNIMVNSYKVTYSIIILISAILLLLALLNKNNEGFKSSIIDNIKSSYRRSKRKARMIKDGFTDNVQYKVKKMIRVNGI